MTAQASTVLWADQARSAPWLHLTPVYTRHIIHAPDPRLWGGAARSPRKSKIVRLACRPAQVLPSSLVLQTRRAGCGLAPHKQRTGGRPRPRQTHLSRPAPAARDRRLESRAHPAEFKHDGTALEPGDKCPPEPPRRRPSSWIAPRKKTYRNLQTYRPKYNSCSSHGLSETCRQTHSPESINDLPAP